jgi:Protein of unknown function (DUF1593)
MGMIWDSNRALLVAAATLSWACGQAPGPQAGSGGTTGQISGGDGGLASAGTSGNTAQGGSSNGAAADGGGGASGSIATGGSNAGGGALSMGGAGGSADDSGTGGGSTGGSAGGASTGGSAGTGGAGTGGAVAQKPRVVVLTDISNEPDDEESLVRFLVYSNEFDVEALVAITSTFLRTAPREDLIRRDIDAYEKVRPNLLQHAPGYPDPALLRNATKTGQPAYGMAAVGAGKASAGSQQLIAVVDKPDPRPVWMTVWGGSNTLAQALQDVRSTRSAAELSRFVAKLRVYSISDQDDAGPWLRKEFPELFYVVSPSNQGSSDYPRATWTGISGDRWYKNGPLYQFDLVDNPWLTTNVIQNHGPLGALYPQLKYIMEGDTPSWLGLVDNGLGWSTSPGYGGWGGRYVFTKLASEPHAIWTNDNAESRDSFSYAAGQTATSDQATIWRWRDQYQLDFAARMNWCVADAFSKANHNPVLALNGDHTKSVLNIPAKSGTSVSLAADGSSDPDGDTVTLKWWIYTEAGTLSGATLSSSSGTKTSVQLPTVQQGGTLHVILQAEDNGTPHLFAYRRAVLNVSP